MNITRNGDWEDNVYRWKQSSSLMRWIRGRRMLPENTQRATFTSTDISKEGYLLKRGSWFKNWKERYFILRKDEVSITYYDNKKNLKLLGRVILGANSLAKPYFDEEKLDKCFEVRGENGTQILLRASTNDSRESWINAIQLEINKSNEKLTKTQVATPQISPNFGMDWINSPLSIFYEIDENEQNNLNGFQNDLIITNNNSQSDNNHFYYNSQSNNNNQFNNNKYNNNKIDIFSEDNFVDNYPPNQNAPILRKGSYSFTSSNKTDPNAREETSSENNPMKQKNRRPSGGNALGAQIAVKLNGICERDDAIFVVLYAGTSSPYLTRSHSIPSLLAPPTPSDDEELVTNTKWQEIARTEVVKGKDAGAADLNEKTGLLNSLTIFRLFNVLLSVRADLSYTHMLFTVYRCCSKAEGLQHHVELAYSCCPMSIMNEWSAKLEMKVVRRLDIELADAVPVSSDLLRPASASLALWIYRSDQLAIRHKISSRLIGVSPYSNEKFSFHAMEGRLLVIEELFIPIFSLNVAKAFTELVLFERIPLLKKKILLIEHAYKTALEELQKFGDKQVNNARRNSQFNIPNYTQTGGQLVNDVDLNILMTLKKIEELRISLETLQEFEKGVTRKYTECVGFYMECLRSVEDGEIVEAADSIVASKLRGCFLKRSVHKKHRLWQFVATNLNIHLMHAQKQIAFQSSFNNNNNFIPNNINDSNNNNNETESFVSVTFGCCAAHTMGFTGGGLRRLLIPFNDKNRIQNVTQIFQTGGIFSDNSSIDNIQIANFPHSLNEMNANINNIINYSVNFPIETKNDIDNSQIQLNAIASNLIYNNIAVRQHALSRDGPESLINLSANSVEFQLIENAKKWIRQSILAERVDIVLSQVISVTLTSIYSTLLCASFGNEQHVKILPRLIETGYLLSVESLLSTQGDELGMLEDLSVGVEWMQTCLIRLLTKKDKATIALNEDQIHDNLAQFSVGHSDGIWIKRSNSNLNQYIIDIEVNAKIAHTVKEALKSTTKYSICDEPHAMMYDQLCTLDVTGVIFSQGINERQTLSNMAITGQSALQDDINQENFTVLQIYYRKYCRTIQAQLANNKELLQKELDHLHSLIEKAEASFQSEKAEKNVHLLLHTSDLCRELNGAHAICCKSGKDRTSMASTLEEVRYLSERFDLVHGKKACKILRRFGVRRQNVFANTEQTKYAFNQLQLQCLPQCYRPPNGTYSGNVNA